MRQNALNLADENQALLREHIDFQRERGRSVEDIVKCVALAKDNVFFGHDPKYLAQLYWDTRYQTAAEKRADRASARFAAVLKNRGGRR